MPERTFAFTESKLRELLAETFALFFEFRNTYGDSEHDARQNAIDETMFMVSTPESDEEVPLEEGWSDA